MYIAPNNLTAGGNAIKYEKSKCGKKLINNMKINNRSNYEPRKKSSISIDHNISNPSVIVNSMKNNYDKNSQNSRLPPHISHHINN